MPRVTDIYAALPAITGKFELEYEGELRGADNVARDLIRAAVGNVFDGYFAAADLRQVTEWFDLGGTLQVDDTLAGGGAAARAPAQVQGLHELTHHAGVEEARRSRRCSRPPSTSSSKGSTRRRRSRRSDEWQYQGAEPAAPRARGTARRRSTMIERDVPLTGNKKKYYN